MVQNSSPSLFKHNTTTTLLTEQALEDTLRRPQLFQIPINLIPLPLQDLNRPLPLLARNFRPPRILRQRTYGTVMLFPLLIERLPGRLAVLGQLGDYHSGSLGLLLTTVQQRARLVQVGGIAFRFLAQRLHGRLLELVALFRRLKLYAEVVVLRFRDHGVFDDEVELVGYRGGGRGVLQILTLAGFELHAYAVEFGFRGRGFLTDGFELGCCRGDGGGVLLGGLFARFELQLQAGELGFQSCGFEICLSCSGDGGVALGACIFSSLCPVSARGSWRIGFTDVLHRPFR